MQVWKEESKKLGKEKDTIGKEKDTIDMMLGAGFSPAIPDEEGI